MRRGKHYITQSVLAIALAMLLAVTTVVAWMPYMRKTDPLVIESGRVVLSVRVYFEGDDKDYADYVQYNGVEKKGFYAVNVTDDSAVNYIENLRIEVTYSGNVDAYIRLRIFEQLTIEYINAAGDTTELSIIHPDRYTKLNYQRYDEVTAPQAWYFADGGAANNMFYYYTKPVNAEDEDVVIGFVSSYFGDISFIKMPSNYSLQIALFAEAVQAKRGPQNSWGLSSPPWAQQEDWI